MENELMDSQLLYKNIQKKNRDFFDEFNQKKKILTNLLFSRVFNNVFSEIYQETK